MSVVLRAGDKQYSHAGPAAQGVLSGTAVARAHASFDRYCGCTAAVISETGVGCVGQSFEWFVHVAFAVVADAQVLLVECCGCNLLATVGRKAR